MTWADETWWAITMVEAALVSAVMASASWFFWRGEPEHRAVSVVCLSLTFVWAIWAFAHLQLILGDGEKPAWFSAALATAVLGPCGYLFYALFFNGSRRR